MPFVINAASHSRILTGAIDHGRELGRREMMVDVLFDYMKPEKNEPQVALLETLESMSEPELLYLYTTQYKERINPNVMRDELNNVKGLTND